MYFWQSDVNNRLNLKGIENYGIYDLQLGVAVIPTVEWNFHKLHLRRARPSFCIQPIRISYIRGTCWAADILKKGGGFFYKMVTPSSKLA